MIPHQTHARAGRWLALAVVVRLLLAATPGYGFDVRLMRSWGRTLLDHPWRDFYATASGADHLPGDIVLHGLLANGCALLGATPESWGYGYALKLVPAAGDMALAGAVAWLLARRGRPWLAGALAVLLSPALAYVGGVWGQWDSVSAALVVGGLALVWTESRWLPLAGPVFAWALLVKPPLAVPIGLGVLVFWAVRRPSVRAVAAAVLLGGLTAAALCVPFGLSAAGLLARVRYAADLWPVTTMGAPNLWMALHGSPWQPPRDDAVRWVGTALFAGCMLLVVVRAWRARAGDAVVVACWAAATGSYASFALLTRAHERYALPGVVLLGVLWALTGRGRALFAAATALLLASCVAVNLLPAEQPANPLLGVVPFEVLSSGTLAVLAALLVTGPPRAVEQPGQPGERA